MSVSLSNSDRALAHTICEELFLEFHCQIDAGHATRALALFSDDPEPRFEVRGEVYEGKAALADFLEAREKNEARQTRHLASNFRFTLLSDDSACATANLIMFQRGGKVGSELILEAVVDCELAFVRVGDDDWRITSRRHSRFATARN